VAEENTAGLRVNNKTRVFSNKLSSLVLYTSEKLKKQIVCSTNRVLYTAEWSTHRVLLIAQKALLSPCWHMLTVR